MPKAKGKAGPKKAAHKKVGRKKAGLAIAHKVGSVGEWFSFVGAKADLPLWAPDAFAISAAFLKRTGGYVRLVSGPGRVKNLRPSKHAGAWRSPEEVGHAWRKELNNVLAGGMKADNLDEARRWYSVLQGASRYSFAACLDKTDVQSAAINLAIASDTASVGLGIRSPDDEFGQVAYSFLDESGFRSVCNTIDPEKLVVLPKQHTPQRGCTIRALSHHLSVYVPTEIIARWKPPYAIEPSGIEIFNMLLLPWPTEVSASDFQCGKAKSGEYFEFEYVPAAKTIRDLKAHVRRAIDKGVKHAGKLHAVVFPEGALNEDEYLAVESVAVEKGVMLISGVRGESEGLGLNACVMQPLGLTRAASGRGSRRRSTTRNPGGRNAAQMREVQYKHHRWCLDNPQVIQYSLGGRFHAKREYWEKIDIERRSITFVTLTGWLTCCALICEDLARQEPVTEVVRGVGPNLVIALLMDAPQLQHRWPSRYASVLAEDPGCSVLTLTSLGMSKRSKPAGAGMPDRSNVIALWRDPRSGEREIALEKGHDACVLSLVSQTENEFSLDGRRDQNAHFPVFAGAYSFDSGASTP